MTEIESPQTTLLRSRYKTTEPGLVLPAEITKSGSFDLTRIEPTNIGKLLQVLQLPILFINMSGEIVFANESCQKISSAQPGLRGTPFLELITDQSAAEEIRTLLEEVFSARKTLVKEVRLGHKNRQIWGRLTFHPARISGKRLVLLMVEDITDLKEAQKILKRSRDELEGLVTDRTAELEAANKRLRHEILERMQTQQSLAASEERFRGIFETARDCVFIKDLSLTYTFVNPYMLNLLEVPESEVVGKTDEELFGAEAGRHLREVDYRVLQGEVIEQEHTRPVKGAPTTFLDVRAPLVDSKGQIVGICGITRNVTERKVLESFDLTADSEYRSPPMRAAMAAARLAAANDSTVLLTGDSGCGKDHLARYIHEHSSRSSGPFYSINCAAIPYQLAESELFGHEPGAFTGASRRKRGLIELAEGGTLLLNEISELSMELQSKLLTFFDTMSFTRVRGQNNIRANVRLLAAANVDLYKQAVLGRFRKDLYYRLNVFTIRIPPLRERVEDLPILIRGLLTEVGSRMGLATLPQYAPEVVDMLGRYNWPGNVRELRNVLERALILSQGGHLGAEHIVLETGRPPRELSEPDSSPNKPFDEIVGSVQRNLVEESLTECGGNKSQAAQRLGISRFALARFMRKFGLDER